METSKKQTEKINEDKTSITFEVDLDDKKIIQDRAKQLRMATATYCRTMILSEATSPEVINNEIQ